MSNDTINTGSAGWLAAPPASHAAGSTSVVHHEDVGAAVYAVIPPRPVPLRKRLFWRIVLWLLRSPQGRAWIARRYHVSSGD